MRKIVVFGTYDILHPGHEHFFKQAKAQGDYLIVVVARDKFVKTAKGKYPKNKETQRTINVRKSKIPNKVLLGSKSHNFYRTIRTNQIEIIALGYDQKPSITVLRKKLKKHRLPKVKIIRLKPYSPNIYKTKLLVK